MGGLDKVVHVAKKAGGDGLLLVEMCVWLFVFLVDSSIYGDWGVVFCTGLTSAGS